MADHHQDVFGRPRPGIKRKSEVREFDLLRAYVAQNRRTYLIVDFKEPKRPATADQVQPADSANTLGA